MAALSPLKPAVLPTPGAAVRLEVTASAAYTLFGNTRVVGLVENTGSTPAADSLDIAVTLLGDGGATVGTTWTRYQTVLLPPGGKAPWMVQVGGSAPFAEILAQAQAEPLAAERASRYTRDFTLQSLSIRPRDQSSGPTISGRVLNSGQKPAGFSLLGVVYCTDGKPADVKRADAGFPVLLPNESSPFELKFDRLELKTVPSYDLFVQGILAR
jgi:hypothetical protein